MELKDFIYIAGTIIGVGAFFQRAAKATFKEYVLEAAKEILDEQSKTNKRLEELANDQSKIVKSQIEIGVRTMSTRELLDAVDRVSVIGQELKRITSVAKSVPHSSVQDLGEGVTRVSQKKE